LDFFLLTNNYLFPNSVAVCVFDFSSPAIFDLAGYFCRHGYVVELSSLLGTVFKGPVEELEYSASILRLILFFVNQDERCRRYRPRFSTGFFSQDYTHARCPGPVCVCRRSRVAFLCRLNKFPVFILQLSARQ